MIVSKLGLTRGADWPRGPYGGGRMLNRGINEPKYEKLRPSSLVWGDGLPE